MKETAENNGNLKISLDVIATIAGHTVGEVEGVASLAVCPNRIGKLFTRGPSPLSSVNIALNDDVATLDVYVNLKYGAKIPQLAESIQKNVKEAVQSMTSITVAEVNVHIAGIDFGNGEASA